MTINDLELTEQLRVIRHCGGQLDRLTREAQYGSLEDALTLVWIAARDARRRVRRLARERKG